MRIASIRCEDWLRGILPQSAHQVSRPVAIFIGTQISRLLEERGLTTYSLHKKTGISYNTIESWIRGNTAPSLGILLFLAEEFGLCSFDELLGGDIGLRRIRQCEGRVTHHRT